MGMIRVGTAPYGIGARAAGTVARRRWGWVAAAAGLT